MRIAERCLSGTVTLTLPCSSRKLPVRGGEGWQSANSFRAADARVLAATNGRISITTPGRLVIQAATVEINGAELVVNTPIAKFSGTVQMDAVIANSVVASSYTPRAGNIW